LNKAVKLYLSLAHRIGAQPYGSNNNLVSISNHVPDINSEVWDLLHQNLKPLRTFLQIILVVALQFMIVKARSHIRKNGLNISTVNRFEVTLYKLPVYACLIHSFLLCVLIEDLPSECGSALDLCFESDHWEKYQSVRSTTVAIHVGAFGNFKGTKPF